MTNVVPLDDYRFKVINSEEELDELFARHPASTIYRMRINYDLGIFKIKVAKRGKEA